MWNHSLRLHGSALSQPSTATQGEEEGSEIVSGMYGISPYISNHRTVILIRNLSTIQLIEEPEYAGLGRVLCTHTAPAPRG